jgi:LysR family transcriptional regulator, nitrogen assimilation regulatory protein
VAECQEPEVELKQLRALVTVAESGSVTRAAQLLHVVQPSISRQITSLERELGVRLFDRSSEGMRPTPDGAILVTRARRILIELERARAEIRPERPEVAGIVTVGILGSVERLLAGDLVTAVAAQHPGIELRLATAYSGHLQSWLDAGDLDMSLLYNLTTNQSVRVHPLLRDQLWAVAPPASQLRADRPVDLSTVFEQPFIMPVAGEHGLRLLIDEARIACNVEPRITVQANTMSLQTELVRAGHGWTILPAAGVADDVSAGRLCAAPIRNPQIVRSVGLALPRTGTTPPAVDAVAAELIRLVRATVTDGRWSSSTPAEYHLPAGDSDT